jgi:AcrR family transcriptional regulator
MAPEETTSSARDALSARERILDTAYELFSTNGIRAVGIERIIDDAGVAKKTLYRHFASKEALVLAFLDTRHQRWTSGWLEPQIRELAATPRERSLALFDALDEWFRRDEYESDPFTCTLLEIRDKADRVHREAAHQLDLIREILQDSAQQAGVGDPHAVALQMQILMIGAIVCATLGDLDAARRARELAALLLAGAD